MQDERHLPLVVDMDGTLLRTDVLYEGMASVFLRNPLAGLAALPLLARGRAPFKRRIAELAEVDVDRLPLREDLVTYIAAEKMRGRQVHLVSAAEDSIVQRVAARVGLFDSAQGSNGVRNLKGGRKARVVAERFPDGFVYAGDSLADVAVWRVARGAVVAGEREEVARRAAETTAIERRFGEARGQLAHWRKALRLQQWAKNILLFAPLLLAGRFDEPSAVLACVLGFFAMGLVASGTYILNDLADINADRAHRSKKTRPFASGALRPEQGLIAAPLLIVTGLAAAFLINPAFGFGLLTYLLVTLVYSNRLKTIPFVDVVALAALYMLRIAFGAILVGAPISAWLLTFSAAFFFSLSLAKRHVEVAHATTSDKVAGRGYVPEDAPLTLAFGVASALASIQILVTYLMEEAFPSGVYSQPIWLWAAPVLISLWVIRIWLLAHRGELDDDPVAFAARDGVSYVLGAGLALAFGAAVFL